MKAKFSTAWKASSQPRKQRKYTANAPLHTKGHLLSVHLSKLLREKHKMRNIRVRTGDKVKVLRGAFKGIEAKVERVDIKETRVFLGKAQQTKRDGSKVQVGIHPSNMMITELNLDDKKRKAKLAREA
ncbi:MAG: 50S ribosomal protein L24 [Candidatus Woesearchaeota archaeon]